VSRPIRKKTTIYLTLLAATLLLAVMSQNAFVANAQTDVANVIIQPAIGGTTNPAAGNYTYPNGTNIIITATPNAGYKFSYWVVSGDLTPGHEGIPDYYYVQNDTGTYPIVPTFTGLDSLVFSDNPANVTCGYGYTFSYQPVFELVDASALPDVAVVVVEPAVGGSISLTTAEGNTTTEPGRYAFPNGTSIKLSATAASGYTFKYWVASGNFTPGHTEAQVTYITDPETGQIIGGFPRPQVTAIDTLTFTTNPVNITCGAGFTFTYQPVFEPAAAPSPSPTQSASPTATPAPTTPAPTPSPSPAQAGGLPTEWIIAIVVVVIIIIAAIAAVMMRRKK
jgi:hypothetical protein